MLRLNTKHYAVSEIVQDEEKHNSWNIINTIQSEELGKQSHLYGLKICDLSSALRSKTSDKQPIAENTFCPVVNGSIWPPGQSENE